MKITIRERTGDFGLEASGSESLWQIVERLKKQGGYYTSDRRGNEVFVPYHQIEVVRSEKE